MAIPITLLSGTAKIPIASPPKIQIANILASFLFALEMAATPLRTERPNLSEVSSPAL